MDEPWKHYAKWKKSDTKDHIFCEMSRLGKSTETGSRLVAAGGWWEREQRVNANGYRISFWGTKNVLEFDNGYGSRALWIYEKPLTVHFKRVNFRIYELHINFKK